MEKQKLLRILKTQWFALTLGVLIASLIVKLSPRTADSWAKGFGRTYTNLTGWIVKYIPFSMTEICVISFIIGLLLLLIFMIRDFVRRRSKRGLNKLSSIVLLGLVFFTIYNATSGVSYCRSNVNLPQYEEMVESSEFETITNYFIDDFNYCASQLDFEESGEVKRPYKIGELNKLLEKEFHRLDDNDQYTKFTAYSKPLITSFMYRELNITGVFFGPTSQANVNYLMTNGEFPFTMAHEMTHAKGILREEDAQLTAMYITLFSDNCYLRYSAYLNTIYSLLNLMQYTGDKNSYSRVYYRMDENIRKNFKYINSYWSKYNLLSKISDFFNDLYLKLEGQKEGTDSYSPSESSENKGTEENPILIIKSFSTYQKMFFYQYYLKNN